MNIKIWDSKNKQWLEPMAIYFGKDNTIHRIEACEIEADPLSDGWYTFEGDDLKYIAIDGGIEMNTELFPNAHQS